MPYIIRKVRNKDGYKVYNNKTKKVYAKCTSHENAVKQVRLLNAIEHNAGFKSRNRKTSKIMTKS